MKLQVITMSVVFALFQGSLPVRADEQPADDIQTLKCKLTQLEGKNAKLKIELENTRRRRFQAEMQLLVYLDEHLDKKPANARKVQHAVRLATRIAPENIGNGFIWRVLYKTKVLKNEMPIENAKRLLGPPTSTTDGRVEWYFNPSNRHVAPYLRASVTDKGLADWQYGRR